MEIKAVLEKLKKNEKFIKWNKKAPDSFFSYALKSLDSTGESPWQLGFYHKSTDKIITFVFDDSLIEVQQEEEIFKKPDMEVLEIETEKVKLPFKKILKKSESFQKEKYRNEIPVKTIAVLQNLREYGNIWNITVVTKTFKTMNVKIDAEKGKIMHDSIESIMDFTKKQ